MIVDLIKKDLSYTKKLDAFFLTFFLFCVMRSVISAHIIDEKSMNATDDSNMVFVNNIATFYKHQQIVPLNTAINNIAVLLSERNVEAIINKRDGKLKKALMTSIDVLPWASNLLIAKTNGQYQTFPELTIDKNYNPAKRPWFKSSGSKNAFISFTDLYHDEFQQQNVITISRLLVNDAGHPFGVAAIDLNLREMGSLLGQVQYPHEGRSLIVNHKGTGIISAELADIGKTIISPELIKKMRDGHGHLYDEENNKYIYYHTYADVGWVLLYLIDDDKYSEFTNFNLKVIGAAFIPFCLIYFIFWFVMRQSLHGMVVSIVTLMRFGRVEKVSDIGKLLVDEASKNKKEIQEARDISSVDGLTGLLNRRKFDNDINQLIDSDTAFVLAMIDIDNFKSINDTYGHLVGDVVLKIVAKFGRTFLGENASVYRYGGEEIAMICCTDNVAMVKELIDEWRSEIETHKWREQGLQVTFSAGLCLRKKESYGEIIKKADNYLYLAKSEGKNRVLMPGLGSLR